MPYAPVPAGTIFHLDFNQFNFAKPEFVDPHPVVVISPQSKQRDGTAIILPISGWISNKVGRKRFYMSCVAIFSVSSLLCGLAPSLGWLVFFRVVQGLGGGGLGPSEQAILADTFPPQKRGMAFAMYGMAVVLAPATGFHDWSLADEHTWSNRNS